LSFDITYTFYPTFPRFGVGGVCGAAHLNLTATLFPYTTLFRSGGKTTVTNSGTLTVNGFAHRYLRRNLDLRGNGSYTYTGYYLRSEEHTSELHLRSAIL